MDRFIDNFYNYKGFGPSFSPVSASEDICAHFKGKVPDQLVGYWKEYGFCGWAEGLFWVVNPQDYVKVLSAWLKDTPFEKEDKYHVISRTAFGELEIWGERTGNSLTIVPQYGQIYPDKVQAEHLINRGGDQCIRLFFASMNKSHIDLDDDKDKPLFDRLKNKLGVLADDEMYAIVPAPALGGSARLDSIQKVKIIEHLAFLADVGEKFIMQDVNSILGSDES